MKRMIFAGCGLAALALAAPTYAADMPVRMPTKAPAMVEAAYNWSGFYVGAHVGYGWGDSDTTIVTASGTFPTGFVLGTNELKGFLGGGQVGFNYQVGQIVFGIEGDGSWSGIDGSETTLSPIAARTTTSTAEIDWIAMITGRVGVTFGNALIYAKGGWAWAGFNGESVTTTLAGAPIAITVGDETRNGYTIGGGIEWGLASNWSMKAEYNFIDFGTERVDRLTTTGATAGTVLQRDVDAQLHLFKVGLNYRFSAGGPLVARY
jgi:outer membrane immunogenic protein